MTAAENDADREAFEAWIDSLPIGSCPTGFETWQASRARARQPGEPMAISDADAVWNATKKLVSAGELLSLAAQTAGGTAGRDEGLCATIEQWSKARDALEAVRRIVWLEPDGAPTPAAGAHPAPPAPVAVPEVVESMAAKLAREMRDGIARFVSAAPAPVVDQETPSMSSNAASIAQADANPDFIATLQGFASMCESSARTGGLSPDDCSMVAGKLRDACFLIDTLQKLRDGKIALGWQLVPAAPSPASPEKGTERILSHEEQIENLAQWLHEEGGFDDAWTRHTWPEHPDDDGRREGGFVKIVPKSVQEKFRDVARRLLHGRTLASLPAEPEGEKPPEGLDDLACAAWYAATNADLDGLDIEEKYTAVVKAVLEAQAKATHPTAPKPAEVRESMAAKLAREMREGTARFVSASTQPVSDQETPAVSNNDDSIAQADDSPDFIATLQGYASMCESSARTGGMSPEGCNMVAGKLRDACFLIDSFQKLRDGKIALGWRFVPESYAAGAGAMREDAARAAEELAKRAQQSGRIATAQGRKSRALEWEQAYQELSTLANMIRALSPAPAAEEAFRRGAEAMRKKIVDALNGDYGYAVASAVEGMPLPIPLTSGEG